MDKREKKSLFLSFLTDHELKIHPLVAKRRHKTTVTNVRGRSGFNVLPHKIPQFCILPSNNNRCRYHERLFLPLNIGMCQLMPSVDRNALLSDYDLTDHFDSESIKASMTNRSNRPVACEELKKKRIVSQGYQNMFPMFNKHAFVVPAGLAYSLSSNSLILEGEYHN
jgi:hypothetical protein